MSIILCIVSIIAGFILGVTFQFRHISAGEIIITNDSPIQIKFNKQLEWILNRPYIVMDVVDDTDDIREKN